MNVAVDSFEEAAMQHLRDALHATTAERWQWLQQAMAFGFATARSRATKGLMTLGPHGEVLWSPLHEARWTQERRLPEQVEVDMLTARSDGMAPLVTASKSLGR